MCGIVGCLRRGAAIDRGSFSVMRDALAHRGPDDAGTWISPSNSVALGSRRLAIQDLSPRGHQPMQDATGSLTVAFNGEIYNFVELRDELEDFYAFRSRTDTEVLLAAYARWGPSFLQRLNGMFAFAIWDEKEQRLFAARDRFGEKPFYYFRRPDLFLFASEMKSILASGFVPAEPNLQSVYRFLAYRETDASEQTLFKDILSLPAGHALVYCPARDLCKIWKYWDLDPAAEVRYSSDRAYSERLRELLSDSVNIRLRSDVAVGSCLSGGIDSSTIVSLAAARRKGDRQCTFSARFEDPAVDEGGYIRSVTERCSTPNYTVYPNPRQMVEELSTFAWHQEHPFAGPSIYAQWCVMRLAYDRGVTVLLDGQGGDELLGGYLASAGAHYKDLFSRFAWGTLAKTAASQVRQSGLKSLASFLTPQFPASIQRMARALSEPLSLNADFMSVAYAPPTRRRSGFSSALHDELYQQLWCSMLPKLLRFADRSSMAFSREVRLPFLDHRVVEFLFAIPETQKIRGSMTKFVLRNAMRGLVPDNILQRTDKKGFETPQAAWLSGPLRPWAESVFHSRAFRERGWIDQRSALEVWRRFVASPGRYHSLLFRWLSLEIWAELFLKPTSSLARVCANEAPSNAGFISTKPVLAQER